MTREELHRLRDLAAAAGDPERTQAYRDTALCALQDALAAEIRKRGGGTGPKTARAKARCPKCDAPNATAAHIIACPGLRCEDCGAPGTDRAHRDACQARVCPHCGLKGASQNHIAWTCDKNPKWQRHATPPKPATPQTPWAVLGLPLTADRAAVKFARRAAAQEHHPARGGDLAKMQAANAAADALERLIPLGHAWAHSAGAVVCGRCRTRWEQADQDRVGRRCP